MLFELLNLVLGIAFGFIHRGKEDYYALLRNGVIVGFVLGIVFVLAAEYAVPGGISISVGSLGTAGVFIEIFLFVVIFTLGAFIGDRLEWIFRK